jgi:hypothetical protein
MVDFYMRKVVDAAALPFVADIAAGALNWTAVVHFLL